MTKILILHLTGYFLSGKKYRYMLCNCTLNEVILSTFSTKNLHVKNRNQIFVKFLGQWWVKWIKFPNGFEKNLPLTIALGLGSQKNWRFQVLSRKVYMIKLTKSILICGLCGCFLRNQSQHSLPFFWLAVEQIGKKKKILGSLQTGGPVCWWALVPGGSWLLH